MSFLLNDEFTPIDHQMAPEQKLDMGEIRHVAPDAIEVIHLKGSPGAKPRFTLYLLKNKTGMGFNEVEIEPSLYADEFASLKQEFEVVQWTMWGHPLKSTVEAEKIEP